MLALHLRDIDCAFKLFPRRLFDQIELHSEGAMIDAEVLGKAVRLGYRIGQVGVHHYPRLAGEPTGAKLRVIAKAFRELAALRREIRATPAQVKPEDRGRSDEKPRTASQVKEDASHRQPS